MKKLELAEIAALLPQKDRILIVIHKSPDGDAVGCGYGLCMALRSLGKQANVLCGDPIPPIYSYLTDLVPPTDMTPEYVVSVDLGDTKLLSGEAAAYKDRIDLCLDHHYSNSGFAAEGYVDGSAASCAEILKRLLDLMPVTITPDIANAVFTGVCTDTGCFRFSSVTAETHRIAAELIDLGADSAMICRLMFDCKSRARVELERMIYEGLTYYAGGQIAVVTITKQMLADSGATPFDTDGIAALARQIEGVRLGVTITEKDGGEFRFSVRSAGDIDASAICACFGGGGHRGAAGCSMEGTLEDVRQRMAEACAKALGVSL